MPPSNTFQPSHLNRHYWSRRLIRIAQAVAPPVLRIALALPFLRSANTRWDGFLQLSVGTRYLFEQQFQLHLFGQLYPLPAPDVLATVTAVAEWVLPSLLLLGLATRLAALGLLLMTATIQLIVPDGWANFHLYWAGLALAIMALGPGGLSLDHLLGWLARHRRLRQTATSGGLG